MSLISDLLSKVKQQEPKRDVPPLLKDSVNRETTGRKAGNKYRIPLAVVMVIAVAGVGAMFLMDLLDKPEKPLSVRPAAPVSSPTVQQRGPEVATSPPEIGGKSPVQNAAMNKTDGKDEEPGVKKKALQKRHVRKTSPKRPDRWQEMKQERASAAGRGERIEGTETISKRDRDVYLYAARMYEEEENYQKALSSYRKALTADPGNYMVMNNISSTLIRLGVYDEAIRYAQEALRFRKDYIYALINMGVAHSQLGQYREGEGYLKRVLLMEPSNRHALLNLGLLYEKGNTDDKARRCFDRLSVLGDARGYLGLARIAEKQGQFSEAINYYRSVMTVEKKHSQAWNFANDRIWQLMR
jgi:Tfp pilus assembly protein PilF